MFIFSLHHSHVRAHTHTHRLVSKWNASNCIVFFASTVLFRFIMNITAAAAIVVAVVAVVVFVIAIIFFGYFKKICFLFSFSVAFFVSFFGNLFTLSFKRRWAVVQSSKKCDDKKQKTSTRKHQQIFHRKTNQTTDRAAAAKNAFSVNAWSTYGKAL